MSSASSEQVRTVDLGEMGSGEVLSDWYNPLIKRREVIIRVRHDLKSTPMRILLRQKLSEVFGVDIKRLYIRFIKTEYGAGVSTVRVHIYNSPEKALSFEPEYIIERNGGVDPFQEEG